MDDYNDPEHPEPVAPKISTPHNNLFQYGMSDPKTAAGLIRQMLPENVVKRLDLTTLVRKPESYVDDDLKNSFSDVVYRVKVRPDALSNSFQDALVYVLMEHKSEVDPLTAFQLLKYLVRIWEQCLRDDEPLCAIVPLVLYHGKTAWEKHRTLEDVVDYPDFLSQYSIQFEFPILDLWRTADDQLSSDDAKFLQSLLILLKYGRSLELRNHLGEIFELLAGDNPNLTESRIDAIVVYIMNTNSDVNDDDLIQAIDQAIPTYVYPDSIVGRARNEGREEGREEGLEKGRQTGVLIGKIQLLEELCGRTVSEADVLSSLSLSELEERLVALQQQRERNGPSE